LLGAVGAYDWSGTVAKYDTSDDKEADIPGFSEVQQVLPNRTKESYLGYSVTTGKYNGGSNDWAASGAPRYYMYGAVVVYRPEDNSKQFDRHSTILPHPKHRQFGSYFGATLLSMDLNNDGKDDLLVGAPLYIGKDSDEGRVFVYISDNSGQSQINWAKDSFEPFELKGNEEVGARFGTSIAFAGDLNKDGYNDVIIGAPMTESGKGAVYVYHGSKDGISTKYRQRVGASDVQGVKLEYFGQSLQGGVDLDNNQYPDVAVGAPKSDTIAIFRTRPVLNFLSEVTFDKANVDIFTCLDTENKLCQSVKVCLTISGEGIEQQASVDMKLRLDPEYGRLQMKDDAASDNGQQEKTYLDKKFTKDEKSCFDVPVYLKDNVQNYNAPATAIVSYSLTEAHTARALSSISDPEIPNESSTTMMFKKKCGSDGVCSYNLALQATQELPSHDLITQKNDKEVKVDLTDGGKYLVIGSETKEPLTLNVTMQNLGEDAFDTLVEVKYSKQLSWNEIANVQSSNPNHADCIKDKGSQRVEEGDYYKKTIQYEFDENRGNIMPINAKCTFQIRLSWENLKDDKINTKNVFVSLRATTLNPDSTSQDTDDSNNENEFNVPIIYRSDITGKRSSNENVRKFNTTKEVNKTIDTISQIAPNIKDIVVNYEIAGRGYSNIPLSKFYLNYPDKYEDGLYLLYLFDISCKQTGVSNTESTCSCDNSKVNFLGLKRDQYDNTTNSNYTYSSNPSLFNTSLIDCTNKDVSNKMCSKIECQVTNLVEGSKIDFYARFRPWTPTFNFKKNITEKTVLKLDFQFETDSQVTIINSKNQNVSRYSNQNDVVIELYTPPIVIEQKNILWIYIIASIGGILLLLLVTFILYKCGFFKSKYAEKKLEWEEADGGDDMEPIDT